MRFAHVFSLLLPLLGASVLAAETEKELFDQRFPKEIKPLLEKHCFECHGNGKKKGGVTLDRPLTLKEMMADTPTWLTALDQVKTNNMPPEDKPELTADEIKKISTWLEAAAALADSKRPLDPGFTAPRRLNKTEYNNTIKDLLGIKARPADDFPADDSGYGFDNIADVLTMSPLLAESYLNASEKLVDQFFDEYHRHIDRIDARDLKVEGAAGRGQGGQVDFASNGVASFTPDLEAGKEYELRVKAAGDPAGTDLPKLVIKIDGKAEKFDIKARRERPQLVTYKFKAEKDKQTIALAFENDFWDANAPKGLKDRNLWVISSEFEGPLNTPRLSPVMKKHGLQKLEEPIDEKNIEAFIRSFSSAAYRRPVKPEELERLMQIFRKARKEVSAEQGLRWAITTVLCSPHFLFRMEQKPANAPAEGWALSDYEIASRLSYFLWSTMPDDELFKAAADGKLKDPAARTAQVKRMLADPKAQQFVSNFAGQWLELRNLQDHSVDNKRYPKYNTRLRDAMNREAELLFDTVVKEDKPVMELVMADYTFVNERLAELYGLPPVKGDQLQRVSTKGTNRGGVLTMGSTLLMTSNPNRTSPVKRGKWVMEQILGLMVPPAPPDIPALPEKEKDEANAPLRKRLETHRANPACASCHNRMDGIGFALENFDAIGAWRLKDGKFDVDSVGSLGEEKFSGPNELKSMVAKKSTLVERNFIQRLMTYALGRGVQNYDRATINQIMTRLEKENGKVSAVILGIVDSDAFLKRRDKRGDE